ncbi:hypothetical protein Glove_9g36 [Diversispora epigaea]|uniref:Uncharacterized protein n=1 Tax=Diversispora epigaea TaxID=1348612 RepID=A0A397JX25_9GLOM|nr:hypothetical protein Glove_9g36 [Diversispora epigaea]
MSKVVQQDLNMLRVAVAIKRGIKEGIYLGCGNNGCVNGCTHNTSDNFIVKFCDEVMSKVVQQDLNMLRVAVAIKR